MDQSKAVKLKDLAAELGLAVSTVSRALSGNGRVSRKTRDRVQQAVKQAHYTPNGLARSLRTRDARNIGIIVPDITNSFFAAVIKGAQVLSRENGYTILLSNSDENPQYEQEAIQLMLEKQVSGLILASVGGSGKAVDQFRRLGIPLVFIDNIPQIEGQFDAVSTNNYQAAYTLARLMMDRGYREIGLISGPLNQTSGRQRHEGCLDAMRERGVKVRKEWLRVGDFKMDSGRTCMEEILALPKHPKALIIANNYMAFGAIRALRAAGKAIPGDMAVASFDTDDISGLVTPAIVTMNQAADEIGWKAAEVLIDRINDKAGEAGVQIVLSPVFADGNSW